MLDLEWTTVLFQIVNFLVLLAILNRLLFRPLGAKLTQRGQMLSETLENAGNQEAEAAQLKSEWEERMRDVDKRAEEVVHTAQVEATQKRSEVLREVREHLDRLTTDMREDLRRQRDELVAQNYDSIVDAVVDLSGNVVQAVTTRRTHDDLVTNFAASIFQMPQPEVEEYRRKMVDRVPTAYVTTPVPLTAEQSTTLVDTLSSLIDRRMALHVTIDASLIAGIQVRLADRLIDNSIRQQLGRIRERVYTDLAARLGVEA